MNLNTCLSGINLLQQKRNNNLNEYELLKRVPKLNIFYDSEKYNEEEILMVQIEIEYWNNSPCSTKK